ncbi:MAG TPA: T9SS type A sorting domain-containing protein [Saprospiraceae bacterium]|nr:T9SS type A sorting domain-containing protein [Saprospiraceae bacterium]
MKRFYSFVFALGMLIAYPSAARTISHGEPSNLICNDLVYLSIEDISCSETINPDMVLEGPIGPDNDYVVELDKTLPMGNGPWVPAFVTEADINFTYTYRVTHIPSGNTCQGSIKIEDKLPPVLLCENFTVPCNAPDLTPSVLEDDYNVPAVPSVTDCQDVDLTYIDQETPRDCASGLTRTILRKWTAVDESGNVSTCEQIISFDRPGLADVVAPPDFDDFMAPAFSCATSEYPTPEWIESTGNQGFPYVFGLPEGCNIGWVYVDNMLQICDGTYVVFRNWTIQDWCTGTGFTKMQVIRVVDKVAPPLTCPANTTVSVDPLTCCATIDMPDLILRDNCSQIKKVEGMVATFDPQTGDPTGMYTFDGSLKDFPGNNWWDADTLADFGITPCLPIGTQTVTYRVEDDCGNTRTCTFKMKIEDQIPPVAVCDEFTTVALTAGGDAIVDAAVFDDGSYDNCCVQSFRAARMSSNGCGGTNFSATVPFCCNDVGEVVTVMFRVTDCNGNTNECMVSVEVQEKIKPSCLPPANVTVNCENFDPSLWAYSRADVEDNCCLDDTKEYQGQEGLTHSANYSLFDTVCNKGTITRTFRAFDCVGNSSQCTQRIFVTYEQDYFIKFPNDAIVTVCDGTGNYGEPLFFGEDCELLGVSYTDEIFTVVPDACFKIERTWQIINWCTYNPNGSCIEVPNPSPNPISNAAANLPGPTVSACGTIAPWAPTSVRINPGDPQPTNFCTFYDKNANCYRYKQIIKIIDGQQPTGTYTVPSCSNQNWATPNQPQLWNEMYWWDLGLQIHDLCEEPTDLCITATDACSGNNVNIEYLLFLDLDGDGSMETVVNSVNTGIAGLGWNNVLYNNLNSPNFSGGTPRAFDKRPVPSNQKYGFAIQETVVGNNKTACVRWNTQQQQNNFVVPELPHGTHKIKWFITDGCGNNTEYEYTFTVKDCKAPTVVCLNGLSVNIMPTGMITLWAADFLQYTEDNCTPANQLKIGIRKCGTGTGFPVDAQGNPITNVTFSCAETGTQCVELWSIDAAGNADYCETYIIVQDNLGNCGSSSPGMMVVSGEIKTETQDGVEEVNINIDANTMFLPPFGVGSFVSTDADGIFALQVPTLVDYVIVPEKDDNPLNGVTTYDLVLISKHILGLEPLNSPYKMIAADANRSGSITTFDIVEIRKLILGIYQELPNNASWRFVDKNFVFPSANNPFQTAFPEVVTVTDPMNPPQHLDFVGVKIGDVNGSVIPNLNMPSEERQMGVAELDIQDREVKAGEELEVTFTAAQQLHGFQFTLLQDGLKTVGVKETEGITAANFGTIFDGATTVSVDGAQSFTLRMRAEKAGKLSDMLGVSGAITRAEAYGENGRMNVALRFDRKTVAGVGFELYQNQPNPFVNKTTIGFFLPEAAEATLSVIDESGRVVYRQKGKFPQGENTVVLDRALLNTTGVLFYQLETDKYSGMRKMVQGR